MVNKKLATSFFYSKNRPLTPSAIWEACGIQEPENGGNTAFGIWGELTCEFHLLDTSDHLVLFIQFWQSEFLNKLITMEENKDDVKQMPLIQAFIETVGRTKPEVAFIATHLHQASSEYSLAMEGAILSKDAYSLSEERFGLLYLDENIGQIQTSISTLDSRAEILHANRYKFVFAGEGKDLLF